MKFYTLEGYWSIYIKDDKDEYITFGSNKKSTFISTSAKVVNIFDAQEAIDYLNGPPYGYVVHILEKQKIALDKYLFYKELLND